MQIHHEPLTDVVRYIEKCRNIDLAEQEPHFDNLLRCIRRFRQVDGSLNMLEVGTGMGWAPIIAKQRGLRLKGLEISPPLVEAAREYGRKYGVEPDIELGNIEEADLGENVYDVIIASSVFEHVEHWKRGLRTVYRGLKPGGLLFFESTNKWSLVSGEYSRLPLYGWMPNRLRYRFRMLVQGPDIMENGIDFHQFTYPGLRRAFREIGFTRWHDRVDLSDPQVIRNPIRRIVLRICKKSALAREVVLTFFEVTTFVCEK